MTLAVAACFPWGRLRRHLESRGIPFERAVILAAESRFTYSAGMHRDGMRKLHLLTAAAALVFAGDVIAAQEIARALRRYGRRPATGRPRDPSPVISYVSQRAHARQARWALTGARPPPGPLHVLIGMVDLSGGASVVRASSTSGFVPLVIPSGVDCAGPADDVRRYLEKLTAIEDQWWKEGRFNEDPLHWQIAVVAALSQAIDDARASQYVGGS